MGLPIIEQETHISIGRDDKKAHIYVTDTRWITKLDKVAKRTAVHKSGRALVAVEYVVPEKWIKVSPPKKRVLSEAQKTVLTQRLQKAREEKR